MTIEDQLRDVTTQVVSKQAKLGGLPKIDRAREALKAELAELLARMAELKSQIKIANAKKTFCGIGSPIHEALVARVDPALVAEIEADGISRQEAREERARLRKASKAAAPPAPPPPPTAPSRATPPQQLGNSPFPDKGRDGGSGPPRRQRSAPEIHVLRPGRSSGGP